MKSRFLFILILSSFLLAGVHPLQAEEAIDVMVSFDKKSASIDEEIHMKVIIQGTTGGMERPRIPQLKGFNIYYLGRASQITIINGARRSQTEFTFTLVPIVAGKFQIPPIEVQIDDSIYRTAPSQIEIWGKDGQTVSQTAPGSITASQSRSQAGPSVVPPPQPIVVPQSQVDPGQFQTAQEGDEIFMRAWTDRSEAYVGEQITLTYSIYYRTDATLEKFEEEPTTTGFWTQEFPAERNPRKNVVEVKGLKYETSVFRKLALFPTRSGIFGLEPGSIRAMIVEHPKGQGNADDFFNDAFFGSGGFFAKKTPRILRSNPIKITVKPLPEAGKPASFKGAVGAFRFTGNLNKRSTRQNEPVSLELIIEGYGNVETIERPEIPEIAGVKIYETDVSSQVSPVGDAIQGRKRFEVTIIPSEKGLLTIPALEFSFFNSRNGTYETQTAGPFQIEVAKGDASYVAPMPKGEEDLGKKSLEIENTDVRYIEARLRPDLIRTHENFINQLLAVAAGALVVLVGFLSWRRRQELFYARHTGLKRRLKAEKKARRGLKRLKRMTRAETGEKRKNFFARAHQVMSEYLADKFNVSAQGLTLTEIEAHMEHFGVETVLQRRIKDFYEVTDRARFALSLVSGEEAAGLIATIEETIKTLERKIR